MIVVNSNLLGQVNVVRVIAPTAAGTSDVNGTGLDMSNYKGVQFIVGLGTITASAVTSLIAEESDDNSTYTAISGASVTIADTNDDKIAVLDVRQFSKRYVRCTVDRGTANAVIDLGIAIQYQCTGSVPITQGSTVLGSTSL